MARHVRERRWLEVLAYGVNDDGVLMLRFDWGDEYPDKRDDHAPVSQLVQLPAGERLDGPAGQCARCSALP
jgi:hypothetical protein